MVGRDDAATAAHLSATPPAPGALEPGAGVTSTRLASESSPITRCASRPTRAERSSRPATAVRVAGEHDHRLVAPEPPGLPSPRSDRLQTGARSQTTSRSSPLPGCARRRGPRAARRTVRCCGIAGSCTKEPSADEQHALRVAYPGGAAAETPHRRSPVGRAASLQPPSTLPLVSGHPAQTNLVSAPARTQRGVPSGGRMARMSEIVHVVLVAWREGAAATARGGGLRSSERHLQPLPGV